MAENIEQLRKRLKNTEDKLDLCEKQRAVLEEKLLLAERTVDMQKKEIFVLKRDSAGVPRRQSLQPPTPPQPEGPNALLDLQEENSELISVIKKQNKLIDVLKRQKLLLEGVQLLGLSESELSQAVELDKE